MFLSEKKMSFVLFCQISGALEVTDTCEKSVSDFSARAVPGPPTSYRVCATPGEADGDVGEHVLGVFLQRTRGTESLGEPRFLLLLLFLLLCHFLPLFPGGHWGRANHSSLWQFPLRPCKMWCHLSQCGTALWVRICQHCRPSRCFTLLSTHTSVAGGVCVQPNPP